MIRYLRHLVFQCKESGCMSQVIRVGMADLNVCKSPDTIITWFLYWTDLLLSSEQNRRNGALYAAGQYTDEE